MSTLPAEDLRAMLVTILAGATDGNEERWCFIVGELVRVDLTKRPQTNWTIKTSGAVSSDRDIIKRAVALMRAEHPYVRW